MPRFFIDADPNTGHRFFLPEGATRHVQVLRMQPGQELVLFNGRGGQWRAQIERIERRQVTVRVLHFDAIDAEPGRRVHLALGMPANERMDWLVEKATELGAASLQALMTTHSVVRLAGERADKKRLHWQAVAAAACEQCGGNRLPEIGAPCELGPWLASSPSTPTHRFVLSLQPGATILSPSLLALASEGDLLFLSGPEGGLSSDEEARARGCGFVPVSLGPRILRAETAALTALILALQRPPAP